MSTTQDLPVILLGYESSSFTKKVRWALRLKQIPYTFITVPSMMPRPLLRDYLHLTYRKIPVLLIGCDVYCDTSIIVEALEQYFPTSERSLYPTAADGHDNRAIIRGFASFWTDRPLFRVATGLLPGRVWRTIFGQDRAGLIGHELDPDKLEAKLPRNLSNLDLHLSILEPQLRHSGWLFSTKAPSLADISLYYQLDWARNFSAGRGINNLTGGGTADTDEDVISRVFNDQRYPFVYSWFQRFREYMTSLPLLEITSTMHPEHVLRQHLQSSAISEGKMLLDTPAGPLQELDRRTNLHPGSEVVVAPDDTGRDDPTQGSLVAASPEEIVIRPKPVADAPDLVADIRLHFPRLGFVAKPVRTSKM